jgi:hypothetical protein
MRQGFLFEHAGEPLSRYAVEFCGAPDSVKLTREGLDPEGQPVSSALVPPDALHAAVDQHYRRQPCGR